MKIAQSNVHFIGIGGIGMCGLAELLHRSGAKVSGSDSSDNAQVQRLKKMGIQIFIGQSSENINESLDVVVYSSAIKESNPEFIEAREMRIPLIPRAEALAEIMVMKKGVAVAGTHGKTTTTSLLASVFLEANQDPTIFVGGVVDRIKSTAQLGSGEWLIAEADESDGSFLKLSPYVSVITNIDDDHLDFYGNMQEVEKAFYNFALKVPFYGKVVACGDESRVRSVLKGFPKKVVYYGFNKENEYWIEKVDGYYDVFQQNTKLGRFCPPLPGDHNALNALAAIVVGSEAGLEMDVCIRGVESFSGVARRSQFKGHHNGVDFYDDYAHHPTEISAVMKAFKEKHHGRLVALFEPHRYTRTKECWEGFLKSFELADKVILINIYPAGETPIEGIHSKRFAEELSEGKAAYVDFSSQSIQSTDEIVSDFPDILKEIKGHLEQGDLLISLGAGKVYRLAEALLEN